MNAQERAALRDQVARRKMSNLEEHLRHGQKEEHRRRKLRPTARELEVLSLAAEGLTNKQIGSSLALSVETVKAHMKHTIGKLNARGRTHAVVIAIRRGLIT